MDSIFKEIMDAYCGDLMSDHEILEIMALAYKKGQETRIFPTVSEAQEQAENGDTVYIKPL